MKWHDHHKALALATTAAVVATAYLSVSSLDVGVPGAINPDVTEANISQNICNPNWSTKSIRPPTSYTNPLKAKLCQEQNCGDPSKYELDHAIALTDGGNPTDVNNLWLQPYSPIPGAHEKDRIEVYIHGQICSGTMTLKDGQNALLHWKTTWKKISGQLGGSGDIGEDTDDD